MQYRLERTGSKITVEGGWEDLDDGDLVRLPVGAGHLRFREAVSCDDWTPFFVDGCKILCQLPEGHSALHQSTFNDTPVAWPKSKEDKA